MVRRALFLLSLVAGCQCGPMPGSADGGRLSDGGSLGGGSAVAAGGTAGNGTAGGAASAGGSAAGGTSIPCDVITATIRDFQDTHPDFETFSGAGATTGLVNAQLGPDGLPVYAAAGPTSQTSSRANFDQWYRDAGVNLALVVTLPAQRTDAGLSYESAAFFPIDGQGFGNQGRNHNFHFTTVIRSTFTYKGGERFLFRGDDDVWIFVNERLALDLGGLHAAVQGEIDFDRQASALGITRGQSYRLDVFHAERHTVESNFRLETSIECLRPIEIQ